MNVRYLSLCSGIEAASVAWKPLGWEPVAFAEIEPFPCAVLSYHYPNVPNLGDMTQIDGARFRGQVDVLVAGTPCQAFSVAGARRGLEDERGNLTLKLVEIANAISPAFLVWENVPGVLSMYDNAFGCFLGALAGSDFPAEPGPKPAVGKSNKYWRWDKRGERHIPTWPAAGVTLGPERAIAWRTLDAQYFGLAQRRRRVFVVACPREGSSPEQILFEWEGLRRDTPPSRKKGADIAGILKGGSGKRGWESGCESTFIPQIVGQSMSCKWAKGTSGPAGDEHHNLVGCVAFTERGRAEGRTLEYLEEQAYCLMNPGSGGRTHSRQIMTPQLKVRRLTPRECERLQGFPDNYTDVEYRGKPAADGPRYKAIGNSMAVNVMRWIGERIEKAVRAKELTHA